jgi:hypothetical protein
MQPPQAVTDPTAGLATPVIALVKTTGRRHLTRDALMIATATLLVMSLGLVALSSIQYLLREVRQLLPRISLGGIDLLLHASMMILAALMFLLVTAGNAFMTMYTATDSWRTALQWVRAHPRRVGGWALLGVLAFSLFNLGWRASKVFAVQPDMSLWWVTAAAVYLWGVGTYYGLPALLTDAQTVSASLRRDARYLRRTAPIIIALHAVVGGGSLIVLAGVGFGLQIGVGMTTWLPQPVYWLVSFATIVASVGVVAALYSVTRGVRLTAYQHATAIVQRAAGPETAS